MSCSSKQRQLCGKEECIICFDRSFASFQGKTPNGKLKVDCWDNEKNGEIKPFSIKKTFNTEKIWFKCDKCPHSFDTKINCMISDNSWCPYCCVPRKKICLEEDCVYCFNSSFASYNDKTPTGKLKIECWDYEKNGKIKPRDIMNGTHKKFWFNCCNSFCSQINEIMKGKWNCSCKKALSIKKTKYNWYNRYNEFKKKVEEKGFTLKTTEEEWEKNYTTADNYEVLIECNKNHNFKISVTNFIDNRIIHKCKLCKIKDFKINSSDNWYNRYNEFKKKVEDKNCILITTESEWKESILENNNYEPNIECSKGHSIKVKINNFRGCSICAGENHYKNLPNSCYNRFYEYKKKIEEKGFTLKTIEEEWKKITIKNGASQKIELICPNKHTISISINQFQSGHGCGICQSQNTHKNLPTSWYNNYEKFKYHIEKILGFKLITTKEEWLHELHILTIERDGITPSNKYKPIVECNKGHTINNTTVNSFISSKTCCYKCSKNGYSKKQIQWLDFISILHDITIQHAINNKEHKIKNIGKVDGYCKEKNTVYEFHGDFFHGNPMKYNILDKNAINSLTKQSYSKLYENTLKRDKKIKELGYNLVIMWENQWNKINDSIKLLQNKWRDYKNKPHKCEKCNISFKFKSQLEKHCKTELHKTGKKKIRSDKKEEFKCEICNLYTTNQQTNLKLHILNNHKTKEERKNEFPYYCELCDSGCIEEKLYKKHLETKKHKKKLDLLSK